VGRGANHGLARIRSRFPVKFLHYADKHSLILRHPRCSAPTAVKSFFRSVSPVFIRGLTPPDSSNLCFLRLLNWTTLVHLPRPPKKISSRPNSQPHTNLPPAAFSQTQNSAHNFLAELRSFCAIWNNCICSTKLAGPPRALPSSAPLRLCVRPSSPVFKSQI
jgi:hypothetical protein